MEIRHFVTFKKVIEWGSFTQAAEFLGYTQSTVTSHIQALEKHIGAPLFDRMGRKVKLTDVGKRLLGYTEEILSTYSKIENIANDEKAVRGELKIAAPESLTVYRLEPILSEYRKKYPHVSIKLSNATCGNNQKALLNGSADVSFVMLPELRDSNLTVHLLNKEPIVVVGSPDSTMNVLNKKLTEALISNGKDCIYRTMFEKYLEEREITSSQIMELWSIEAIKQCVMSGLGITCLPFMTVIEELHQEKLKIIPCEGGFQEIFSQVAYHKNKWISPALSEFIAITLKHAKSWS
ncbi:LysR family transcriptional regulator [Paenibacillus peoriae]|uniref:LysR family transcriptional regulator n=1 Tax=Paenibacillus polymyxa TaxID=1406 RepID=A0AAP4A3U4_PAEPO|nr:MULTISPECIES: LysR family transcriptional regulator [Paenibacillus]ALA43775.1 LysR family transcriptional regulator [Paenibacillus peoriae]APB74434.1 transcriptional regulator CynR [Paenibacillus polymyxa]MDH2332129.1 LysR family transcriptional regulator [Paenibacillus polymyxa]POR25731.1 LysR family transcriptional regulator [Paenibacillus polymyxa]